MANQKKLGIEARESMKEIKNDIIINKWTTLLLSVYQGIDVFSIQNLLNDEIKTNKFKKNQTNKNINNLEQKEFIKEKMEKN